jgi:hypothetical protein
MGAFQSGFGLGMTAWNNAQSARDKALERERQAKDDAWKEDERNRTRAQWAADDKKQASLSMAMRPAQVDTGQVVTDSAGSNAFTKDADAAAVMQDMAETKSGGAGLASATRVNDAVYTDPSKAKAAASEYDGLSATLGRASAAVMPQDPKEGLKLRMDAEKAEKEFLAAGMVDVTRSAVRGDEVGVFEGFNRPGSKYKLEGVPTKTVVKKKTPWGGESEFFEYMGTIVMPDGSKRKHTVNSLDLLLESVQFPDLFKTQAEAGLARAKHRDKLEAIKAEGEQDRLTEGVKASRPSRVSDNSVAQQRLIFTTQYQGANQQLAAVRNSLRTLMSDRSFMRNAGTPGTPQHAQLEELQSTAKMYEEQASTALDLLSQLGGQGTSQAAPGLSSASAGVPPANAPANSKSKGNPTGAPVKVTSPAEHAALPKGTKYIAPNGQTYIKQ